MSASSFTVSSQVKDYTVHLPGDASFLDRLAGGEKRVFIVDEHVWAAHRSGVLHSLNPAEVLVLPIHEERKVLATVEWLYDRMMDRGAKRDTLAVAIGGGITQDLVGFMASTLFRGIGWIFVPTTLLSQGDGCLGGKTSLNYRHFKNLLGTFHPPTDIYVYAPFVDTLSDAEYASGMGEIVKTMVLGGEQTTATMLLDLDAAMARDHAALQRLLERALVIKKGFIEADEFDTGYRHILNYGHCFGHGVEAAMGFAIPHGQCVLTGMIMAGIVARNRGLLAPALHDFVTRDVVDRAYTVRLRRGSVDHGKVVEAMKWDKKRKEGGDLAIILLTDGYEMVEVHDMTEDEALGTLDEFERVYAEEPGEGVTLSR